MATSKKIAKVKTKKYLNYLMSAAKLIIGLFLFSGLILFILNSFQNYKEKLQSEPSLYSNSHYDIVFLNNNLFYFCKLEEFNSEYIKCNDPYYLVKRKETQLDGTNEDKVYVTKPSDEEIYQPDGPIYLRKENIVYIAKVGDESVVKQYIDQQPTN